MAITNLTPDIDAPENQLCAGRWYLFDESDVAITYEWNIADSPPASTVTFASPNGKQTHVKVSVLGEYCFFTSKGTQA